MSGHHAERLWLRGAGLEGDGGVPSGAGMAAGSIVAALVAAAVGIASRKREGLEGRVRGEGMHVGKGGGGRESGVVRQ